MLLLKNGFLEKIETWHVGLSCQYTHFMSFSSKSEHDTIADQATLTKNCDTLYLVNMLFFLDKSTSCLPTPAKSLAFKGFPSLRNYSIKFA